MVRQLAFIFLNYRWSHLYEIHWSRNVPELWWPDTRINMFKSKPLEKYWNSSTHVKTSHLETGLLPNQILSNQLPFNHMPTSHMPCNKVPKAKFQIAMYHTNMSHPTISHPTISRSILLYISSLLVSAMIYTRTTRDATKDYWWVLENH